MDAEDAKTYRHRAATWRGRASEFPADSPKWQECLNIAHQYDNLADLIAGAAWRSDCNAGQPGHCIGAAGALTALEQKGAG